MKNSLAHIILLSILDNNIIREFRKYYDDKDMWSALKDEFDHTSVTKLRTLTIKFDPYKKCLDHTMSKNLLHMSNMVNELKNIGNMFTKVQ